MSLTRNKMSNLTSFAVTGGVEKNNFSKVIANVVVHQTRARQRKEEFCDAVQAKLDKVGQNFVVKLSGIGHQAA